MAPSESGRVLELMAMPIQPDLRHLAVGLGMSPGAARMASKIALINHIIIAESSAGAPEFSPDDGVPVAQGDQPATGQGGVAAAQGDLEVGGEGEAQPGEANGGDSHGDDDDDGGDDQAEGEPASPPVDAPPRPAATINPDALPDDIRKMLDAMSALTGKTVQQLLDELGGAVDMPPPPPPPPPPAKPKPPRKGATDHPKFPDLMSILRHRDPSGNAFPPALVGPMGVSKTYSAHRAANELGVALYPITLGRDTSWTELFGYRDLSGTYQRTVLRDACDVGGLVLFDELDLVSGKVGPSLNTMIENRTFSWPDGVCGPINPGTIFMAACNTRGQGADATYQRNRQDGSLIDRFLWIDWPLHKPTEVRILKAAYDHGQPAVLEAWVDVVEALRTAVSQLGLDDIPVSPRVTYRGGSLLTGSPMTVGAILSAAYLARHERDAQERILSHDRVRACVAILETVRAAVGL